MSRETLQVHLNDLRSLKRLSKITHSLADLLDGIIKIRRSVILPISRHLGLASLPSEIFLCIFSQFIGLFEDVFEGTRVLIRDLSLVSRHFRQMVIKCQEAWTYLDLNRLHSVENLDVCMSRAKGGPLSVRYRHFAAYEPILLQALTFHDRWRHAEVAFPFGVHDSFLEENQSDWSLASQITFPMTRSLELMIYMDNFRDKRCPRWTFPALEAIKLTAGFPQPGVVCYDSLREVTFIWLNDGEVAGLADLGNFLRPATALHTLRLGAGFLLARPEEEEEVTLVELPSVKVFCISNWGPEDSKETPIPSDDFARIVNTFVMPNVEDITVSISFGERSFDVERFLHTAFPRVRHKHPVHNLAFNAWHMPRNKKSKSSVVIHIHEFFDGFPRLQRFELDSGTCEIDFSPNARPDGWMEQLRLLEITYDGSDIDKFCRSLKRIARAGKLLKDVEIDTKYSLDIQNLKEILPNANIRQTCSVIEYVFPLQV